MSRPASSLPRSWLLAASLSLLVTSAARGQDPTVTTNGSSIQRYLPFEVTLTHHPVAAYANPFWDVAITATFTSPGGAGYSIDGFCYDLSQDQWMVRFAPLIEGTWSYSITMTATDLTNGQFTTSGTFQCVPSALSGPLRIHPTNHSRLLRDNGEAFNGIGTNVYTFLHPFLNGAWTAPCGSSLGLRWSTYFAEYAAHGCNFYRVMVGNENISDASGPCPGESFTGYIGIWSSGVVNDLRKDRGPDKYSTERALALDAQLREARNYDMAVCLTLLDKHLSWSRNPLNACNGGPFATPPPFNCNDNSAYPPWFFAYTDPTGNAAIAFAYYEKYARYMVARYAAFVDIWELFGEYDESDPNYVTHYGLTPDGWKSHMAASIRSFNPYSDIVCTGRPGENGAVPDTWQDIQDAHRYTYRSDSDLCVQCGVGFDTTAAARDVDQLFGQLTEKTDRGNRPFMFGECGFDHNMANDDPDFFRIAVWMAYHRDCTLGFWDASLRFSCASHPDCSLGNFISSTYQTPLSRSYFGIRQAYAALVPQTARAATAAPYLPTGFDTQQLRAWSVWDPDAASPTLASAHSTYIHNFASHTALTQNKSITVGNLTNELHKITWIDPKTGATVASSTLSGATAALTIPDFTQDIALLISPGSAVHMVTTSVPTPVLGVPYFQLLQAQGGGLPYSWSIVSGGLPVGMQLDTNSGLISGAPQLGGNHAFTARVTAQDGSHDDVALAFVWTLSTDSIGSEDGYVSQGSGPGHPTGANATDSSNSGIMMGDNSAGYAYRGVFSFNSTLPAGAVVDSARLVLTSEVAGDTPGFPPRQLVIKTGTFGSAALQPSDYNAAGTVTITLPNISIPNEPWTLVLDSAGIAAINTTGKTQMRLQWSVGTNGDAFNDFTAFCPGEFADAAKRPHLVLTYH